MKGPYARHLPLRIANLLGVYRLLGLEHGVDAFCGNDGQSFKYENEGGVLPVEHDNVDLIAEIAKAIDDKCGFGLISLSGK